MSPTAPPMEFSLDPIIYFYTHSLFIIAVSAVVFTIIGVWLGHLTWAKYKRRARAFQEECDLLRHEIAALKRRIGEDNAGPAPLVLINEDAPVPVEVDNGPVLPGFETSPPKLEVVPAPLVVKPAAETINKVEPHRESLADVVIGPAGAIHHTLEPVPLPDSIADFSGMESFSNGSHPSLKDVPKPTEGHGKHRKSKTSVPSKVTPIPAPEVSAEEPPVTTTEVPEPEKAQTAEPAAVVIDAQSAFAAELAEGTAVSDPVLGILLRFQPERWDDLTLLRGVGEVLQQRLHDHGVHTFKQIAYWNEANVEAFSSKIEARDRIQREHWVTQARDMHFLKYGEKLA